MQKKREKILSISHFYGRFFPPKLDKYALTWLDVWNCYNSYVLLIGQSIVDLFLIWLSYKPRCSEKLIRWRSIGEGLSEFHHFCFGFCSFVVHGSCFVFLAVYLLLSSYYIYYPWLNELVVFGWKSFIYLFIYILLFLVSTRNISIRWVIRRVLRLLRNWFSTAWILLVLKEKKKLKIIIWKRHIQLSQWDIRTIQSLHWIVFQVPHLVMNIFLSYKGGGRQVL